jgi:NAD(P)-dependent dehydrogenase (short-subunit alcohol dehydrogenase family)
MPTALITGASRGLGRALALDFARDGYVVYATGRTQRDLDEFASEAKKARLDIRVFQADAATDDGASTVVQRLTQDKTRLDVIIHNAGLLGDRVELAKYPVKTWDDVMATNVRGPFVLTQRLLPHVAKNAALIFVSSGIVDETRPRWGAYYVSKVAVEAIAKNYAVELESEGIRVYIVNPGPLRTEMRADAFPKEDPNSVPAPEEHTGVFLWLAKEAGMAESGKRFEAQEFRPSARG